MTEDRWQNTVWDTDIYLDEIDKEEARMNKVKAPPKPNPLPMTNEEWLRSCPPQELIRFLMNVAYGGQIRNVQKNTFDEEAEKWSKWLEEKHHAN